MTLQTERLVKIPTAEHWHYFCDKQSFAGQTTVMRRIKGQQIVVTLTADGPYAYINQCPHQGYPLTEGTVTKDCILTCPWHNWKFDLKSGDCITGGDQLSVFPVDIHEDKIWINLNPLDTKTQLAKTKQHIYDAFFDADYERLSRETTRLTALGVDPLQTLAWAITWSWDKLETGWTHAYAGLSDWISLYEQCDNEIDRLVCLQEALGHIAEDIHHSQTYAYTTQILDYSEEVFCDAIESEQEDRAIAYLNGALKQGMTWPQLEKIFTKIALAHYNDFGHSLIYVTKVKPILTALGPELLAPLLRPLVRSLVFATREDTTPPFKAYRDTLKHWNKTDLTPKAQRNALATHWRKAGVQKSLALTLLYKTNDPLHLYDQLVYAAAYNMLYFDISYQDKTHGPVSSNISWLNFSHGITFAIAVRQQASQFPEIWPQGFLQLACFIGRNASFIDDHQDQSQWFSNTITQDLQNLIYNQLDHGWSEYIVSVHYVKTLLSVQQEIQYLTDKTQSMLFAAVHRFVKSPFKRRLSRRIATQSIRQMNKVS